jgi:hypothetical protein
VDTLAGVTWANRGGDFRNGATTINLGGNAWVPDTINGYLLTNHVIAHLINPRDAHHRIRVSNIRTALGNFAGTVNEFNSQRDWYQGDGMRLITPAGVHTIVTIFFD